MIMEMDGRLVNRPSVRDAREQEQIGHGFSTNIQAVFQFLIQVFIGLIQVKYQNTGTSPFDTHGTTMSFFILVLLANVYAKYLQERTQPIPNRNYLPIIKLVCQISVVVAYGLLLSILLPSICWWIIVCPCALKSIRELHASYQQISELLHDIYQHISESLHDIYQQISELLHDIYQQISESLHDIYQQISELLHDIYQQISESLPDIYQQISESLINIYQQISESLHGISARAFNKLHDTFNWICNIPTQQARPPRAQNV